MTESGPATYRVTIRYRGRIREYEVFELRARDLPDALRQAVDRFPEEVAGSADLIEIRRANPAGRSGPATPANEGGSDR